MDAHPKQVIIQFLRSTEWIIEEIAAVQDVEQPTAPSLLSKPSHIMFPSSSSDSGNKSCQSCASTQLNTAEIPLSTTSHNLNPEIQDQEAHEMEDPPVLPPMEGPQLPPALHGAAKTETVGR